MPNISPGDLVTFPLRGDRYGVALVVHVDDLALQDLYHFAVCDAVIGGEEGGIDEFGSALPRDHDPDEVLAAPVVVEHIALTRHGLDTSDLVVVTARDLDDAELAGYRTWLRLRYEDAVRRGVLRERIDDNPESEEVEEETEETGAEQSEYEVVDAEAEGDGEEAGEAAAITATTLGVHDVALGVALVRNRAVFEREAYRDTTLGRFIVELGDDSEAIEEIVQRLIGGDYAAGDELIDYGEAGMRALGAKLDDDLSPEVADDVLQVLVNSGESVGYEIVGDFMSRHGARADDPLYGSAVRAYCYAVMLTAGEPEPLKERLSMLESVRDPDLADDVRSAREALAGEG